MGGGLFIAVGSLALGALPGPGTLTFFLGMAMIAGGEFRPVARLLDWGEVRLGRAARETWSDASPTGRAVILLVVLAVVAALAYGAYGQLFGGRG